MIHGQECYEAWRDLRDCPHERQPPVQSRSFCLRCEDGANLAPGTACGHCGSEAA